MRTVHAHGEQMGRRGELGKRCVLSHSEKMHACQRAANARWRHGDTGLRMFHRGQTHPDDARGSDDDVNRHVVLREFASRNVVDNLQQKRWGVDGFGFGT